ncbi:hypothetical protein FSP39_007009 [Pinctada imbricata]|uniref:SCP domain-containing protein n=1 Tax=Pinctada imbricata TaxID=66713 RepID=A0AA89BN31_PINIB|nr:hypothetical protein FSP39_007009 [Pinctada imbricata]
MVRSHNALRQCHGCSDLSQAEDLSKDAQMWADIIAEKGFLQYSELSGRGENIIFLDTNGLDPTGAEVTKMWYGQQKFHDFNNPRWRKDTMNFSQVVWRSTSEIGVGVAKIKGRDKMVVVAQYRPAGNGNMPGEFRKNVPPPHQ